MCINGVAAQTHFHYLTIQKYRKLISFLISSLFHSPHCLNIGLKFIELNFYFSLCSYTNTGKVSNFNFAGFSHTLTNFLCSLRTFLWATEILHNFLGRHSLIFSETSADFSRHRLGVRASDALRNVLSSPSEQNIACLHSQFKRHTLADWGILYCDSY